MKVREILKSKSRPDSVVTVTPHTSIDVLAHRLKLERIGAVVVSEDGERVNGIISERDVVRGLAEHGDRLRTMKVSALMTRAVTTCGADSEVGDVMHLMTAHRIRHLPVVENGRLLGIISIGDVVKSRLDDMQMEANVLRDYIVAHQ